MARTKTAFLAEADELIHKSQFSREDASRVESILAMADRLPADELANREPSHIRELGRLPHNTEFVNYIRAGKEALDPEARSAMARKIQNALTTVDAAGGYLVPQSFSDRFETMLKRYDGLFDLATLFETSTGSSTGFPVLDDVGAAAAVVAENNPSATNADAVFATVAFNSCPTWRTGFIAAPVELVGDSAFDFQALLAGAFAVRIARGVGASFVTKLLSSATQGKLAASATAITSDEIFDLIDSLDPDYAVNGSFLMRRSTFTALSKLKATAGGQYVFPQQLDAAGRPLLCGYPVYMSPSMGAMTAGLKPISFGDHSKFIRRQVRNSFVVKTYVERQAELGRICFEGFARIDGDLAKGAATSPVKYLQQAAS
jgi:HK97 family phage major capsid protein